MTLTSQLRSATSPLRLWMGERLPQLPELVKDLRMDLAEEAAAAANVDDLQDLGPADVVADIAGLARLFSGQSG